MPWIVYKVKAMVGLNAYINSNELPRIKTWSVIENILTLPENCTSMSITNLKIFICVQLACSMSRLWIFFWRCRCLTSTQLLSLVGLYGPHQGKNVPSNMPKMCGFTSSCACERFHLDLCSPLIHSMVQERETNWNFTGCQMLHFMIVLISYTNLLNLSLIIKCQFLRNMEPLRPPR